jgi:large subunit ribosomal protein L29
MAEKKHRQNLDDLRNLNDQELADTLANERRKLYEARSKNVTRQLENTAAIGTIKKQIARILTLQRERDLAAE